jgi:PKD repeat protein
MGYRLYFVLNPKSKITSMKTMLPVLFFTILCLPLFSNASPQGLILSFSAVNRTGCLSVTTTFSDDTFTFAPGDQIISYAWDFGDGNVSTDFDPAPSHTYTSPGSYNVTMSVETQSGWTGSVTMNGFVQVGSNFSVNLGPDTTVCGSAAITLDATTANATYLWSVGGATPTISTTATGQVSVIATRYGCIAKDTVNITRNLLSVELGPDQDLCDGSTLTLSGGNAGADILWSTGETTADIIIWDGGLYKVVVTKDGCSAEDSVNINWKPELELNFGYAKVGGCMPVDMKFTDSSTVCSGSIVGWLWNFGDGTTSTDQNPVHTFTSAGSFNVRLKVTAASGSTLARTKKVTITPPVVSVNLGLDTTICFGETLTLNAANPGADYTWSTGENSQQIDVYDDGDYWVTVNSDGCIAKDTITVKTAVSATANWGFSVGGNCLPIAVAFSDSSSAFCGQSIISWKWNFGDGATSTQRNPVHIYSTADSFTVKLTVTTSGSSTASKTKKVVVTNTGFTVGLPESLKVCRGGSVTLDAGVTGAQYAWSPSFGLSAVDVRNPTLTPATNSWYTVDVTKCSVTVSDSVLVKMDSLAKPVITQSGNSLKSPDAAIYEWYFGAQIIEGAISKSIRVDKAGYYSVKTTNSNGCTNQSDPFFYIPVSGDEKASGGFLIKISPNPAHGEFNILFSDIPSKAAKISIYDAAGKRLMTGSIQDHVNKMNVGSYMKGLYFVEIIINTDRQIFPVVLQ